MAKAALQLIHPGYLINEEDKPELQAEKAWEKEAPRVLPGKSRAGEKKERTPKKTSSPRRKKQGLKVLPVPVKKEEAASSLSNKVPLYIWLFALCLLLLGANQVRYHFLLLSEKEHSSRLLSEEHLKLQTVRNDFSNLTSVVRFLVQRQKAHSEIEASEGDNVAAQSSSAPLLVSTVSAARANLREAPGEDSKVLMNVTQGSRLLVEEQKGQWLKVYAPNGMEAWVREDLVSLETQQTKEAP